MLKLKANWKILGGCGKIWVWPLWSKDTKIGCISKRNQWNKLVFGVLIKIHVEDY